MKKILCSIMALLLLVCLAACGGASDTPDSTDENNTTVVTENKKDITFEEMTVVDNDECKIKITGIDEDNLWGYTLKAEFENKSADKTYMFAVRNASVNGVQSDPFFASEVASGKKAVESISFSDDTLKANEIEFTDIEITFTVSDSNDWLAESVAVETVHIYPFGVENAEKYVREAQASDTVLIDNNNISVILTDIDEESLWGYTLNLFIQNKTDKTIMLAADDVSVNGYMADPFYAESIGPNMCAFSSVSWYDSAFEELGITEVEEIELVLRAYDYDNWSGKDLANEKITIAP